MDLQARADRLAQLMEQHLGVRGTGFEAKLARAGRRLPRHLRGELAYIAEALHMQAAPRLARQIDWERVERGFTQAETHLKTLDLTERRTTAAIRWFAGNALNILIVAGLLLAVLVWRGFL